VPDFIESVDNSDIWQHGMTDAALAKNLTVQWCYAAPTDVLNSLAMPALTNFRVSNDFCYGESWNVGVSSLIVWAAGSAPSKDTLWTTDNGKFSVPGCAWTPDHEEPAAELHVVIALMTMGPVGISDLIGTVIAFRQKFTLVDAIGSHASSLEANIEANMRMTNGFPLGSSLLVPVCTVHCVQTLKVKLTQLWPSGSSCKTAPFLSRPNP
jgi:hypothetical protein